MWNNLKNMENKEFSKIHEARTKVFAIRIIKLSANLMNSIEEKIMRNQLTKAGTSIGANYREANRARSKADFKNKIKICESEANETGYWLEIIDEFKWIASGAVPLIINEADELPAIFTSF